MWDAPFCSLRLWFIITFVFSNFFLYCLNVSTVVSTQDFLNIYFKILHNFSCKEYSFNLAHLSWLQKSLLLRLRPFENFPLFWMSSPQTDSGLFSFAKCMPCEVTPSIRAYREGLGTTFISDVSYRSGPSH